MIHLVILGVGRWGVHYVRHLLTYPHVKIVAIIDGRSTQLQQCREKFSLPDDILLDTDWKSIFTLPHLDGVVVVTPAVSHYEIIKTCLDRGYHILAEKPLTLKANESLELCYLAKEKNRQLFVDHTYLFNPAIQAGKKVLDRQQLGNLYYGYSSRTHLSPVRQDVSALWDLAIHDIAIFNYWLQETPCQVSAKGQTWLQPHLPDVVWCDLIYPSGFQATLHLAWLNTDKQRKLTVVGSQGSLIFDELSSDQLILKMGNFRVENSYFIPENETTTSLNFPQEDSLKQVCNRFLSLLETDKPCPLSSGWEGWKLVSILEALEESLEHNGKLVQIESSIGENRDF